MSSSAHRDIVDALDRLRSGASSLSSEQYVRLLDAVEQASTVLHLAPRGGDPAATGVWYHHERGPALARLADALNPDPGPDLTAADRTNAGRRGWTPGAAESHETAERRHNAAVIRALQESIQEL